MEKRRRAERLIASLRWVVAVLGLAAASDVLPITYIAALMAIVAVYNGAMAFCVSDQARFVKYGRRLSLVNKVLDVALITFVNVITGPDSYAFLLYWIVLINCGYTSAELRKLLVATGAILAANAVSTLCTFDQSQDLGHILAVVGLRSGVIIIGLLVAAYVSHVRSQDELASERGSYLHAILNVGARLTSFRNVHELALYVLESAVTETDACGGQLLLVNDDGELECEAFYPTGNETSAAPTPTDAQLRSCANWVLNSGREFTVRTATKNPGENEVSQNDRPVMAAPLLWQASNNDSDTSVLGVLMVWGIQSEDFGDDALDIVRIFAAMAGAAIVNLRLYTNLQKSFLRTLQTLANGLEARDEYTRGHSERVMQVACLVAEELGVRPDSIESLRNAALLHDIGKIGVPDSILRKAGKLTVEEWETMRRHPIVSEEICRPLGLPNEVLFLIKHHQERLDGKGYPAGLSAQDQPLLLRILVVVDSFDAMRSRRPYRDRMPQEELVNELNRCAGRTLDPTVVDALKRIMDRGDLDHIYEELDRTDDDVDRVIHERRVA